jgi:glycerate 2-kinase
MTKTPTRKSDLDVPRLIQAILQAVDPYQAVQRHVLPHGAVLYLDDRAYDPTDKDIRLIAVGKAAVPMAQALRALLGALIARGVVVTKYGHC